MNAVQALEAAHAAGIHIELDGDQLVLEAPAAPPNRVVDLLARHKFGIIALLRPHRDGWSAEDWQAFFHLKRTEAETQAFECCVIEWLNQNPAPSAAGQCGWCRRAQTCDAVVLPFGTEPGTHAWLHAECWKAWHHARRAEAAAALTQLGIRKWHGTTAAPECVCVPDDAGHAEL